MSEEQNPFGSLRILPDWLKESENTNRYANYEGGDDAGDRRRGGGRDFRRDDRKRPGGDRRNDRGNPGRRDDRTQAKQGRGGAPERREQPGANRGPRPEGGQRRQDDRGPRRDDRRDGGPERREPQVQPANVRIDFIPEAHALEAVSRELRAGHITHPLFDLARLFLQKPDRYLIVVETNPDQPECIQAGDGGPIAFNEADLERDAYRYWRNTYFTEETQEVEPPKGNFAKVARCPLSGVVLGPPSHHAFQPALRSLYESRFSRRMSFEDYRRRIETTDDAEAIEKWKEQASRRTVFKTTDAENPQTFDSPAGAESHFRVNIMPTLIRRGKKLQLSGRGARATSEPSLLEAMKQAFETEQRFPAKMGRALQHSLGHHGLHFFKHRKKIVCLSPFRPARFPFGDQSASKELEQIVNTVLTKPGCSRKALAKVLLPEIPQGAPQAVLPSSPNPASSETTSSASAESTPTGTEALLKKLASNLHFLIQAGHLLEFPDGRLDAAYPPNEGGAPSGTPKAASDPKPAVAPAVEGKTREATQEQPASSENETAPEVVLVAEVETVVVSTPEVPAPVSQETESPSQSIQPEQ